MQSTPTSQTLSFRSLGIHPSLVKNLEGQGIETPFPIQEATLPDALQGHDILARSQTGSGKTLAFTLALLTKILGKRAQAHIPLALVLAPTRELASQIDEVIRPLARSIGHESIVISGGVPYPKQIRALERGVAILVATPGRLIDLMDRKEVVLDHLIMTVLDEADEMAEMGFLPTVKRILNSSKKDSQRMLFSATLDRGVDTLVKQYLREPKSHSVDETESSKSNMDHYVFVVDQGDKASVTNRIAAREGKTIFFVRTQRGADRLTSNLAKVGVFAQALHGGKSQAVRSKTLARFKESSSAVLVATDVAARGIHVEGIDLVVHFDVPADHKDYLHRSGRTARAGEAGRVVTLVTRNEQRAMNGIALRAGVETWVMAMTPMHKKLTSITGATEPTGVPLIESDSGKGRKPMKNFKRGRPSRRDGSARARGY